MRRVFDLDVPKSPRCNGRISVTATIGWGVRYHCLRLGGLADERERAACAAALRAAGQRVSGRARAGASDGSGTINVTLSEHSGTVE
jgi:hypothetical protein